MRWTLEQGPYALQVINDSHKSRRPVPAVFCDLPEYDEESLRVYFDTHKALCLFRGPVIDGRIQRLTIAQIADYLRIKQWDDDPEFVDDILYFIPLMDDVFCEVKQRDIDNERKRKEAEKRRNRGRKLTNKGKIDADDI